MGSLYRTERLNALTDAVIAVLLTLLVIDLEMPDLGPDASADALWVGLMSMMPRIELWLASFLTVGVFWVIHHDIIGRQERLDELGVGLGLLLMAGLTLLPFSVAVAADYPDLPLSVAWFWGNVFVAGALMAAQLLRISRLPPSVRHPDYANSAMLRGFWLQVGGVPTVAALCLALAPLNARLSLWGWVPVLGIAIVGARARQVAPDPAR